MVLFEGTSFNDGDLPSSNTNPYFFVYVDSLRGSTWNSDNFQVRLLMDADEISEILLQVRAIKYMKFKDKQMVDRHSSQMQ